MSQVSDHSQATAALELAARLAISARNNNEYPLDPIPGSSKQPNAFEIELPRRPRDPLDVIGDLDRAARGKLSGTTKPGFMGWVIGGSNTVGIAADWLATAWGQNACLHNSSPASAEAEAASARWILDLLDLPRNSSVGFTTGATMAAFTSLAAARLAVLERAGHDFERKGLFGCPEVTVYICDDAHVTNYSVLRYLGFGDDQIRRVPSIADGTFNVDALERAMRSEASEARIVIAQAGQIMSGGFDNFTKISRLCSEMGAWLHVDGAFGLWVRASRRLRNFADGVELADSWSVDGHKWLQLPYDCGFAIVRHEQYHRRAMSMHAGYLPEQTEVRNNSDYVPELSRRARGFAAWAVMQSKGRSGIAGLVEQHCNATHMLANALKSMPGVKVLNQVWLNQLAVTFQDATGDICDAVCDRLNSEGNFFVRTADWKGRNVLRFSLMNEAISPQHVSQLIAEIKAILSDLNRLAA